MKKYLLILFLLSACTQSVIKKDREFPKSEYHHLSEVPDDPPPCELYLDEVTEKTVCLKRASDEEVEKRFPNQPRRFRYINFRRYLWDNLDGMTQVIEQYAPLPTPYE